MTEQLYLMLTLFAIYETIIAIILTIRVIHITIKSIRGGL